MQSSLYRHHAYKQYRKILGHVKGKLATIYPTKAQGCSTDIGPLILNILRTVDADLRFQNALVFPAQ